VKRIILIGFLFEIGIALLIVPWSAFWDRNYFLVVVPALRPMLTSNFTRGAVSGLGLVNVLTGLGEVVSMLVARHSARQLGGPGPRPAP
jgi:hypothetical protein